MMEEDRQDKGTRESTLTQKLPDMELVTIATVSASQTDMECTA